MPQEVYDGFQHLYVANKVIGMSFENAQKFVTPKGFKVTEYKTDGVEANWWHQTRLVDHSEIFVEMQKGTIINALYSDRNIGRLVEVKEKDSTT